MQRYLGLIPLQDVECKLSQWNRWQAIVDCRYFILPVHT